MLRTVRVDEVDTIREWRNQSANREVSKHQHVITPEDHRAWWERDDPGRRVLIFEEEGRARGVVTYSDLADSPRRKGSWGFFLDHETAVAEGTTMLLWVRVMADAVDYAFDELGLDVLEGEVLEHNEVVRTMNRRFRFAEGDPVAQNVDGRTISVIPISLERRDRRPRRRR